MSKEKSDKTIRKFNKDQILMSEQFTTIEKDVLRGVLEDKEYTLEEVKTILKKFKEKEVE